MNHKFIKYLFFLIIYTTFHTSHAKLPRPISEILNFNPTQNTTHQQYWRTPILSNTNLNPSVRYLLAGILSFIAAAISSAGGIGGGGLYIPILTIVAALDLKTASTYSAFMVTGGSIANVACHMFARRGVIDYDIALLSEPCMLLGVSCGVICNLVLPEWLITIFFVIFLTFCTFKTCKSGVLYWKLESEGLRRNGCLKMESEEVCGESTKEPLLSGELDERRILEFPWMKIGMLFVIWFSFFVLYLLRGNRSGQGIIQIEPCGTGYWLVSSIQIPLTIIFTMWILYYRKTPKNNSSTRQDNRDETQSNSTGKLIFPIMALLAGVLGGVFGIGGGMLISPLLLQIGIGPEVTAATCSFMVFFSSTMSAVQYLLLGMEHVFGALTYASICFVGSLVGLTLVQQAIMKHGRASLIVFSVGTVMALSTVLITSFGAVDVWRDYTSGKSMGFKGPC
ncbi:hypothetical protein RD792_007745 [Penstemon davidsonii]|uniref:Sulfite exporter TauE/SafE family protein n=1 Tax=Penstemon davidsonii TaxID=160366 RepID=A0ABR0D7D6_9LAMI|nr:hypothetical protein RD792_007745 [Penstemon davidsonii]